MRVQFHKHFTKQYKKYNHLQKSIDKKLGVFIKNPFDTSLNNHGLSGKYKGFRSINITGDLRAIFEQIDDDTVLFIDLNSHSNLYK